MFSVLCDNPFLALIAFTGLAVVLATLLGYLPRLLGRSAPVEATPPAEPIATIILTSEQTLEIARLLDAYYSAPSNSARVACHELWSAVARMSGYSEVEWLHRITDVAATQYVITVVSRRKQ